MKKPQSKKPESDEKFRDLFNNMSNALALHEMIFDTSGKPIDYRFIDVNPAFVKHTGLKPELVLNKTVKEVLPNTEDYWIEKYGNVVLTGQPDSFQEYSSEFDKYFDVTAYKINANRFAVIFNDITDSKKAEMEKEITVQLLKLINSPIDLYELMKQSVHLFMKFTGCEAVGIRLKEGDDFPYFETEGFPDDFIRKENNLCATDKNGNILRQKNGEPVLECMCGNILQGRFNPAFSFFTEHGSFWSGGTTELLESSSDKDRQAHTRNYCNKRGYESVALIPLRADGETFGLLQLNDRRKGKHTRERIQFLEHLADYCAIGFSKKKSDNMLRQSEEKFRTIFENVRDVFYESTPDGILTEISPSIEILSGGQFTREDLIGKPVNDLYSKKGGREIILSELRRKGSISDFEITLKNKDNSLVQCSVSSKILWDSKTGSEKIIGSLRNITERKIAENALLISERRLRRAQNISQIGHWEIDLKNMKIWASENAFKIYGVKRVTPEMPLNFVQELVLPQYRAQNDEALKNLIAGTGDYNLEFQITRQSDGQIRYVHSMAELVLDSDGNKIGVHGVLQDITERINILGELKESEERYRKLVELSPDAILIHQEGKIVYINSSALKLFGASIPEQLVGTPLIERVHPDFRNIVVKRVDKINNFNAVVPLIEEKIVRLDGSVVDVEVAGSHFIYKGEPAVQVIARDITERRIFIDSLRLSEERFRSISNTISDLAYSCVKDENGTYKLNWITGAAQIVTGYTNEEILEKQCWGFLVIEEDIEIFNKNVLGLLPSQTKKAELRIRKKDGQLAWVMSFAECAADIVRPGGYILYGGLVNITERKVFEAAIQESEERFRTLIENAPDGIELLDLDGNFLEVNSASCMQIGYSREELSNMKIFDVNPGLSKESFNRDNERLKLGMTDHREVVYRHKDGTLFPVEVTSCIVKINGQKTVLGITRDITGRKKSEMELDRYRNHLEEMVNQRTNEIALINEKLTAEIEKEKEFEIILRESLNKEKELNELKSRFISTASHEFKTPLTTILSSVDLIQRYGKNWEDEKRELHIVRIQDSVDHLSRLIDDVLTISRSESGKMQNNPEFIDLKDLCNKFIDEVRPRLLSTHKLSFKFNSEKNEFRLDPKLMRYIIINLLTNAIKYSPEGGVVELAVTYNKDFMQLTVRDEGIGILPEDEKHLYEPFFRAKNALEFEGTGLGLSIVKRSVEVMNGAIDFISKSGKGTTVEIKIPGS